MGKSDIQAVKDGAMEVALPVITTITTTIMAFLPLIFMSGIMGKFMKIMPVIVMVTLAASLFESLFMLPAHLLHDKPGKTYSKKAWVKKLELKYKAFLSKALRYRYFIFD